MTAPVFADTNVLVYARDAGESEKQPMAVQWLTSLWKRRLGRLSYEVLNEYYVTVTRKLRPGTCLIAGGDQQTVARRNDFKGAPQ